MKKLYQYLLVSLLVLTSVKPMIVKAASVSAWADQSTVEVGDTVTFTVSASNGVADVYVSGAVSDHTFLDNESTSYTVTATEAGTLTIYVSGTIADNDTEEDEDFSTSASVTVVKPNNGNTGGGGNTGGNGGQVEEDPTPEPEPEPEEKSDDARLYWLTVDKGTLTPEFSSDVTEYKVELTSEENEIYIDAEVWDDNATLSGTGLKILKVGSNSFTVDVTAEDGSTRKAYTINVNVKEVPSVYFNYDNKKLGILNEVESGDVPKGFSEKTIQINGQDIKAFTNEAQTLLLVFMVDEQDNKGFYIYSETDKTILGLYKPLIIDGKEYFQVVIPENLQKMEGMSFKTLNIDQTILPCWNFENEKAEELKDYSILYLMDTDGQKGYYAYNTQTKHLKAYTEKTPVSAKVLEDWLLESKDTPWLLYGGIAAAVLIVIGIIAFAVFKKKKKKTAKVNKKAVKAKPNREHDRKLVTDETFFKEIPHEDLKDVMLDAGMPLTIENALNEMDDSDFETKEPEVEQTADINVDDDWIDEKMINTVLSDDDDE